MTWREDECEGKGKKKIVISVKPFTFFLGVKIIASVVNIIKGKFWH